MATTAKGKDQYLAFAGMVVTDGAAADIKATFGTKEIDLSVIGSNWEAYDQGQANLSLAVSGVWDAGTATTALDAVMQGNINAGGTQLFAYMPQGSAATRIKYAGNGFLSAYEVGGAVADKVGFSCTLRAAGSVTRTTT